MTQVKTFSFNPFQENTYVLYDETKACAIFDPGCYYGHERKVLQQFIADLGLKPQYLINTHCHLDHVFGNRFVAQTYGLKLSAHRGEQEVLDRLIPVCKMYGIPNVEDSPLIEDFLEAGTSISFGQTTLKLLWTPGHSPASLSFYNERDGFVVAGDVLFQQSIGRTDLPGGDYETLIASIKRELLVLPDDTVVYSGHGPSTRIGQERKFNPFLQ